MLISDESNFGLNDKDKCASRLSLLCDTVEICNGGCGRTHKEEKHRENFENSSCRSTSRTLLIMFTLTWSTSVQALWQGHHIYHGGMIETVKTISRQEGFMALYRGLFTSLLGMAPYGGLSFWAFERSKLFVLANFPGMFGSPHAENMDGLSLYPLDVARRKLQLSTMLCEPHKYDGKSIWQILVTVRNDHGVVKGLFRGITVNYWRGVPSSAISFTMFEMMKQLLGLDTGVTR
ncbi:GDC-like protein [Mya arenaria]|uniref:GDC-like protein n=1 Tax=Mya arenaria TaxID=6604 RepID=A0ABY7DCE6_MYAAR|nr:GDC-like protein [Mya arenaria]